MAVDGCLNRRMTHPEHIHKFAFFNPFLILTLMIGTHTTVRKIFQIEEVDSDQRLQMQQHSGGPMRPSTYGQTPSNLNKNFRASDGGYNHGNTAEHLNAKTAFLAMSQTMGEGVLIVTTLTIRVRYPHGTLMLLLLRFCNNDCKIHRN